MSDLKNPLNKAASMRGNWTLQINTLKEKFSSMTEEDLKYVQDKEEELLERIENRINNHRAKVINLIKTDKSL